MSNSDFQDWYEVTGLKTYYEPGLSKEETSWGTGNPGVVTLGAANVTPYGSPENVHAILKTVELPLGALLSQGIGAGSMFTGFFKLNLSNPISSVTASPILPVRRLSVLPINTVLALLLKMANLSAFLQRKIHATLALFLPTGRLSHTNR